MSQLVLAATFPNVRIASIAQGMLKANGIPSILDNAIFSSIYPIEYGPLGEVRLMVNASDYDEAVKLLGEHGDLE